MSHAAVVRTARVPVLPSLTPQPHVIAQPPMSTHASNRWQQMVTAITLLLTFAGSWLVVDVALDATVAYATPVVSVIQTQHVPGEQPVLDVAPAPSLVREAR